MSYSTQQEGISGEERRRVFSELMRGLSIAAEAFAYADGGTSKLDVYLTHQQHTAFKDLCPPSQYLEGVEEARWQHALNKVGPLATDPATQLLLVIGNIRFWASRHL